MSRRDEVISIIRGLSDNFTGAITDTTSILSLGIDSLKLMEMVLKIEGACGIEFTDSDLLPSNLATVGSVLATVERLKS